MTDSLIIRDEEGRAKALRKVLGLDLSKPQEVTIALYKGTRRLKQNRHYHWILGIIAQETGNSHDAIHDWVRDEFLAPVTVDIGGKVKEIRRSTTTLKVDEMAELITKVMAWASADLGIILPADERGTA